MVAASLQQADEVTIKEGQAFYHTEKDRFLYMIDQSFRWSSTYASHVEHDTRGWWVFPCQREFDKVTTMRTMDLQLDNIVIIHGHFIEVVPVWINLYTDEIIKPHFMDALPLVEK